MIGNVKAASVTGSVGSHAILGGLKPNAILGNVSVGPINVVHSNVYVRTTEEWSQDIVFVPGVGDIIVYSDRSYEIVDGETTYIPGIKIGDGNAHVVDLPFIDDRLAEDLINHINDDSRHVTEEERTFWNNKLNYDINDETLLLTRL